MQYRPQPYAGPVHLFQASGSGPDRQAQLAAAVRELCTGPCTITPVPGDHWAFIRAEHAIETATELDAALERAGAAGSSTDGS